MNGIFKLAFSVLMQMAMSEPLGARLARGGAAAALAVLALVALLGGAGCGFAALWIFLIPYAGPVGAPLIVGGIMFFIAAVLLIAGLVLVRRRRRQASAVDALVEALKTGDATKLMRDHKAVLLLFAVLTGLTAASKIGKSGRKRRVD